MPRSANVYDWNEVWSSKRLEDLHEPGLIGNNAYGTCGCRYCGFNKQKPIQGKMFKTHMERLYRHRSPPPASPASLHSLPLPSLSPIVSPRPSISTFTSQQAGPSNYADVSPSQWMSMLNVDGYEAEGEDEDEQMVGRQDQMGGITDDEDKDEAEGGQEDEGWGEGQPDLVTSAPAQADHSTLFGLMLSTEGLDDFAAPNPYSPGGSPELPPVDLAPSSHAAPPPQNPPHPLDLIDKWPFRIPQTLLVPPNSGRQPNPYLSTTTQDSNDIRLSRRLLPLLAHALVGTFNCPRRAAELVLRVGSEAVRLAEKQLYERVLTWYTARHGNVSQAVLDGLDASINPALEPAAAPHTLRAALRQLDIDEGMYVHAQCSNHDCSHVFYETQKREDFRSLEPLCPDCGVPLRDAEGNLTVLHFPRRSLHVELEGVLNVPGIEEVLEQRKEMKRQRDEDDAKRAQGREYAKVYRQQDDGTMWEQRPCTNPALVDALTISVNFSLDWANPSRSGSAASDSFGPITLNIASLPSQLRSSFTCTMILGITPGPRQPRAVNVYKHLLPLFLELRDAELEGVWVRTPKYPQGRLVRVLLACVCCDRPAAIDAIGGSSYTRKTTPCLRCDIHFNELASKEKGRPRVSHAHNVNILQQRLDIPRDIHAAKTAHDAEQERLLREGSIKKKQKWTVGMAKEVEKASTIDHGNVSAACLIPGFDKFPATTFDPMHALLEGAVKLYFNKVLYIGEAHNAEKADMEGSGTDVGSDGAADRAIEVAEDLLEGLQDGQAVTADAETVAGLKAFVEEIRRNPRKARKLKMMPSDVIAHQQLMRDVIIPTSVPRLHPRFGTASAGTPTANHWRAYATVYAPLTLPLLFHLRGKLDPAQAQGNSRMSQEELDCLMMLSEITALAMRSSISDIQVNYLERKMRIWREKAYTLHPSIQNNSNIHVLAHLTEDIRNHGPMYGWWTFLVERINYVAKATNRSGGTHNQAQVVTLRAVLRSRAITVARLNHLEPALDSTPAEREAIEVVTEVFGRLNSDPAANALEHVGFRYDQQDKRIADDIRLYRTLSSKVELRGVGKKVMMDALILGKLAQCLESWGMSVSTEQGTSDIDGIGNLYVYPQATIWQGMTFMGRRFDSAQYSDVIRASSSSTESARLVRSPNAVFETRTADARLGLRLGRCPVGVLCLVFEHRLVDPNGNFEEKKLYGLIRRFKAYETDIYGYNKVPTLSVHLWEADCLEDLSVVLLTNATLDAMLPVALARLPKAIEEEQSSGDLWATLPVYHHKL